MAAAGTEAWMTFIAERPEARRFALQSILPDLRQSTQVRPTIPPSHRLRY